VDVRGLLVAILAASAYSTEGVLGKFVLASGAATPVVLAVRFAVGAAFLWVVVWLGTFTGRLRTAPDTEAVPPLPGFPFPVLVLVGSIGYSVTTLMLFYSFERLPSGLTLTILYIYPVLVAVGSSALGGEPLTGRAMAAAFLGFVGVAAVGSPTLQLRGQLFTGVLLALGAAVVNAAQLIWTGRLVRRHNPLRLTALYLTHGSLLLAAVAAVLALTGRLGARAGLGELITQAALMLDRPAYVLALGLLPTSLAAVALFVAMNRIGASRTSLVATTEPPLALLWGALFLQERFLPMQLAGAGLIVLGILILFRPGPAQ